MKVGQNADKKQVLNELLEMGMVLVAIDARAAGVDVPDHLGIDPQLRLNLSWRFGRPMDVDEWGIQAELTFSGEPYPCKFPWDAIFLIVSHINGESYLFPDHVPKELLQKATQDPMAADARPQKTHAKRSPPKLSLVSASETEPQIAEEGPTDPVRTPEGEEAEAPSGTAADADPPKKPARSRGHLRLIK